MRVAVAGGTGLVGRQVVDALRAAGHQPVVLARSTGVDLVAGTGVEAALAGAAAVVDVSNVTTTRRQVRQPEGMPPKLTLDLHDIYNRGGEIDRALRAIMAEAVEKKAKVVEIIPMISIPVPCTITPCSRRRSPDSGERRSKACARSP